MNESNNNSRNVDSILNRIKEAYNIDKDVDLADFFGVKPNTISAWRKRNSMDYELMIAKCEDLNMNWVLYGVGRKFLKDNILYHTVEEPAVEYSESNMIGRLRNLPIDNDEKLRILDYYLELLHKSKKSD